MFILTLRLFFFLILRPLHSFTLFPYTTLFRSALTVFDGLTEQQLGKVAIPDGPQYLSLPPGETVYVSTRRGTVDRSEEHTSELQSPDHLVCRLLLEKKKYKQTRKLHTPEQKQE